MVLIRARYRIKFRGIVLLIVIFMLIIVGIRSCVSRVKSGDEREIENGVVVNDSLYKIYIDPGHGGSDPGAEGDRTEEKDLTLKVGLALNDVLLESNFQTYMSRVDDSTINVRKRPGMANETDADVFVSIHFNAADPKKINNYRSVSGIETFYYENTESDSPVLAKYVQEALVEGLGFRDRGYQPADHCVTRETTMPAILIELGFLSNYDQENFYLEKENIEKAANCIKEGIENYFEEKEGNKDVDV